jgi:hypothetical protein
MLLRSFGPTEAGSKNRSYPFGRVRNGNTRQRNSATSDRVELRFFVAHCGHDVLPDRYNR